MPNPHASQDWDEPTEFAELEQQTRQLLADAGARPRDLTLSDQEQQRTSATARAALDAMLAHPTGQSSPRRAHTYSRRWALVAAVAAVITIVGIPVAQMLSNDTATTLTATPPMAQIDDGGRQNSADTAAVLSDLAAAAVAQPKLGPEPVQLVVTEHWQLSQSTSSVGGVAVIRSERYILPDGAIRIIQRQGQFLDNAGQLSVNAQTTRTTVTSDDTQPGPASGPDYPNTLSSDPATLTTQLVPDITECPRITTCLARVMIELHRDYALSPQLTAALWNALAQTEDVAYLGQAQDRLGRAAVVVQVPGPGDDRYTLIYAEPATGAFLGSEEILNTDDPQHNLTAPAVVSFTMIATTMRIPSDNLP